MGGFDVPAKTLAIFAGSVLAIAVCGYSLFSRNSNQDSDAPPQDADVTRAISGHTIKIDPDQRVNYAGIRAPYRHEPLGDLAFERNRQMVESKRVRLRFDQSPKDSEGRWVAYVFADGQMVNRQLVEEGLAYVRLKAGEHRFAEELLAAQRAAREAKRGVWASPITNSETRYVGDRKYGVFHRPDCADITNIKPGDNLTFAAKIEAFDQGFAPCGHCAP